MKRGPEDQKTSRSEAERNRKAGNQRTRRPEEHMSNVAEKQRTRGLEHQRI